MKKTFDLTTGNVFKALVSFSIPGLAALFLQALYGAVDLFIVGQFADTADVSGVSTGSILISTITLFVSGLAVGVTIYVGNKIGEKNKHEAGKAVGTGIAMFAIIAVIISILLVTFSSGITKLLNAPEGAFYQTRTYIRVCGFGMIFVIFYNILGAIFRAAGDSKTPLYAVLISCSFNIIGDYILVSVFNLGTFGVAIATVVAQAISVIFSLIVMLKKDLPFDFNFKIIKLDKKLVKKELKFGIPLALQEFLVGISFVAIQAIINTYNVSSSAAVGVGEKACGFIMLISSAISQAVAAFVAQNIGAKQEKRAKQALYYGIAMALSLATVIAVFTFFRGDLIASIFTSDTEVIALAHLYLKSYAFDTVLTSILFCLIGYFNGCGHTLFVMIQGLVGAGLIRIPFAFIFNTLPNTNLFIIGLATPLSSLVQIIMFAIFTLYLKRKNKSLT